jgi:hypothetical protein|tara:strand:+ start:180 stop:527 length:348 start_codon:yes stop_codon:yes gene_type:complete
MKYAVIDDTTSPFLLGRYPTLERAEKAKDGNPIWLIYKLIGECEPMKTLEDEEIISAFFAGLELFGQRQPNGTLKSDMSECVLDDWPDEVAMCGHIFTLENVIKGKEGYENAVYV